MYEYKIEIKLKSDTLIGSGEGYGVIIDTDVVYDEIGIPYIPGKRIKGILLESAEELNQLLNQIINIDYLFGKIGEIDGNLKISNFFIKKYNDVKEWLKYLSQNPSLINKNSILQTFTNLRYSTAINNQTGIAKEHSLRTERVINKGHIFIGGIDIDPKYESQLALVCQNIKRIGTKRNRGLGEVELFLVKNETMLNKNNIIESLIKEVSSECN